METLLSRYRNITVLLLVILAQLVLIALQVRSDRDVRLIRVWSVTAVTPLARVLETVRSGTVGFIENYIAIHDARAENRRLQAEVGRLKMENQFLQTELSTADRAKALIAFQARTPSRMIAARIIASGATANSKVVFADRGSGFGVEKGMAVVTPDGIVGKVINSYPTASEVLLITDPDFAAGVISQKGRVVGTLRGQGYNTCKVDYVLNEEKVEVGEWFYTSGDDRVFPKGFPVGVVRAVRNGSPYKDIYVEPSGMQRGLEEVLIVLQGVHQAIPEAPAPNTPVYIGPPPPHPEGEAANQPPSPAGTDADRLRQRYLAIGEAQGHKFGEGGPGTKPPDFNLKPSPPGAPAPAPAAPKQTAPKQTAPAQAPSPQAGPTQTAPQKKAPSSPQSTRPSAPPTPQPPPQ
jgi:rod shape-determining protein MreC